MVMWLVSDWLSVLLVWCSRLVSGLLFCRLMILVWMLVRFSGLLFCVLGLLSGYSVIIVLLVMVLVLMLGWCGFCSDRVRLVLLSSKVEMILCVWWVVSE